MPNRKSTVVELSEFASQLGRKELDKPGEAHYLLARRLDDLCERLVSLSTVVSAITSGERFRFCAECANKIQVSKEVSS